MMLSLLPIVSTTVSVLVVRSVRKTVYLRMMPLWLFSVGAVQTRLTDVELTKVVETFRGEAEGAVANMTKLRKP